MQENAFKQTLGIVDSDDTDGSSDISTDEDDMQSSDHIYDVNSPPCIELSDSMFFESLTKSEINWFELVDSVESLTKSEINWFELVDSVESTFAQFNEHSSVLTKLLDDFFLIAMESNDVIEDDKVASYRAFKLDICRQSLVGREANALNGLIVSDNESESPDDYLDLDVIENAERLIAKYKRQLERRNRYLRCKKWLRIISCLVMFLKSQ